MNEKNVKSAIEIMRGAKNLKMTDWQQHPGHTHAALTIKDLHKCGNTACFAGYVAISEEFKAAGGWSSSVGMPMLSVRGREFIGVSAIRHWLGISRETATLLIHGHDRGEGHADEELFYGKKFRTVVPEDVMAKLELILDGTLE